MSSKRTDTIFIHMLKSQKVEISRIFYILDYISNLLLLLQLKETKISYHNGINYIIPKKGDKEIA